jgi:GLPGLI family protein
MKKYKLLFAIIFILVNTKNALGQILDSANIKCNYKLKYIKDTSNKLNILEDDQVLLVGSTVNLYFSYTNYKSDSTLKEFIDRQKEIGNADISSTPSLAFGNIPLANFDFTFNLFVNKTQQLITVFDKIVADKYTYIDSGFIQHWVLADDTSTIMGYKCQKANGYFRGRNYIAWFTKDIPINSGPFKFYGLPGLILRIYDLQKNFDFECVGIEKLPGKIPIIMETKGYQMISRSRFESLRKLFFEHPFKFMLESSGNANTQKGKDLMQFEHPLPYNPIELE